MGKHGRYLVDLVNGGEVEPIEWKNIQKRKWDFGPAASSQAVHRHRVSILTVDTG